MVRNWKAEFVENASSIFEEHGKAEREVKRKEAAAAKERANARLEQTLTPPVHLGAGRP